MSQIRMSGGLAISGDNNFRFNVWWPCMLNQTGMFCIPPVKQHVTWEVAGFLFTIFKHLQAPNWSERTRFLGQRYRYPQRWWNTGMTALQILTAQNMKGVDHCYDSTLSGGDYSEGPQLIGIGLRLHMVYLPDWSQIGYWNRRMHNDKCMYIHLYLSLSLSFYIFI